MRTILPYQLNSTRKPLLKFSSFFILLICTVSSLFLSTSSFAQEGNCTSSNCVSSDIKVQEVKLVQKLPDGTYTDLPKSCSDPNETFNVSLQVKFNVTSQTRYGFLITGTIYINDVAKPKIAQCTSTAKPADEILLQGDHLIYVDKYVDGKPIIWKCGEKIELKSTYTAWNSSVTTTKNPSICTYYNQTTGVVSANACKTIAPKCKYYGPNESFTIVAPLAPSFSIGKACGTNDEPYKTYTFTSTTTGGYKNPSGGDYTYRWYINYVGDGSDVPVSSTNTLTYTPSTGGDFRVRLVVTDQATQPISDFSEQTITPESCCQTSTAPTGATKQGDNYCANSGSSATISVTGGALGTGASWKWYAGGCGTGTSIGTGSSIQVSPTATTTYYVRAEGDCGNTDCASVTVNVKTSSTAPTGATKQGDNYCANSGSSATISVTGGALGTGASWKWYAGGCGTGTSIGTGSSIQVSPTATTTYYVRAEGDCGNTDCASVEVVVKPVLNEPAATVTHQPTCSTLGTVTVTSPVNTVTYKLTDNSDNTNTYTAVSGVFSSVAPGTYSLTASKAGSCSTDGDDVVVNDAPTAPDMPVVDVKTAASCSSSTIVLEVKGPLGDYEYSNNGGDWQSGVEFTIKAGDGYSIKARRIGLNSDCESAAATCTGETKLMSTSIARQQTYNVEINLDPQAKVTATPNPFNDRIRFSVKSALSGQGSLELYNMMGQKVKTVYQGYITAGQVHSIEYFVPGAQRSNLIYVFRVGDQQISGKLINIKQ